MINTEAFVSWERIIAITIIITKSAYCAILRIMHILTFLVFMKNTISTVLSLF